MGWTLGWLCPAMVVLSQTFDFDDVQQIDANWSENASLLAWLLATRHEIEQFHFQSARVRSLRAFHSLLTKKVRMSEQGLGLPLCCLRLLDPFFCRVELSQWMSCRFVPNNCRRWIPARGNTTLNPVSSICQELALQVEIPTADSQALNLPNEHDKIIFCLLVYCEQVVLKQKMNIKLVPEIAHHSHHTWHFFGDLTG